MNSSKTPNRPPHNTRRVAAWRDLPQDRTPARYSITDPTGRTREITLKHGNRIILDALLERPLFCASPVRISDRVCILRHEYQVPIEREMYEGNPQTGAQRFGVYTLGPGVCRIKGGKT